MAFESDIPALVSAAKQGRISPVIFRRQLTDSYVFLLSPQPVQDLSAISPVLLIIDMVHHLVSFSSLSAARSMTAQYPYYGKVLFSVAVSAVPAGCGLMLDPGSITGFALSPVQLVDWREFTQRN